MTGRGCGRWGSKEGERRLVGVDEEGGDGAVRTREKELRGDGGVEPS